jgi:hypothetical protein
LSEATHNRRWKWLFIGLAITGGVVVTGVVIYVVAMIFGAIACLGMTGFAFNAHYVQPARTANAFVDALVEKDYETAFDLQNTYKSIRDVDEFMDYIEANGLDQIAERGELVSVDNNRLDLFRVQLMLEDGTARSLSIETFNSGDRMMVLEHNILVPE